MKEIKEWKRPQDIKVFRTSNPDEMIGKYLVHAAEKTWTEDFIDEDSGEVVSIERHEVLVTCGYIDKEKLQEIMFAIQSGDIEDVEVCEDNVSDMKIYTPDWMNTYNVELRHNNQTEKYVVCAQTIPQAIVIACEFGQLHRGMTGYVSISKVIRLDVNVVPDDHQCIPEDERIPAQYPKEYFKVTVRDGWNDELGGEHREDTNFIITANDVGEAKERIARMIEINRAIQEKKGEHIDKSLVTTIRKALPFKVDCVVPMEYSELYKEKPKV